MEIKNFMEQWYYHNFFEGKSFAEIMEIEGFPLSWFYSRYFLNDVLPSVVNPFPLLEKNKELSLKEKIKYKLFSKIIKKYIYFNEKRKIIFTKRNKLKNNLPFELEEAEKKNGKALFITYTNHLCQNGDIFRINEIISKIKERGTIPNLILVIDYLSGTSSHNKNKTFKDINTQYNYYDKKISLQARQIATKLNKKWKKIPLKKKEEMFNFEGKSLFSYFKYSMDMFFSKEFIYVTILNYFIFKKILKKENIKAIMISSQNSIYEKGIIAAASKKGIKVFRLQHGTREDIVSPDKYDNIYKLVFSEKFKQEAIKAGWRPEQIIIVGPVIFDEIIPYISETERGNKRVLFATGPFVQSGTISVTDYQERIREIIFSFKKYGFNHIDIKLHPREIPFKRCAANYEQMILSAGFNSYNIYQGNASRKEFYESIQKSELFINFGSTAAVEAMIIGRPILTIDLFGNGLNTNWIKKEDLSFVVSYEGKILDSISKALKEDKIRQNQINQYVLNNCGIITGKAWQRVVELIEKEVIES
jgi:hypothetical protein